MQLALEAIPPKFRLGGFFYDNQRMSPPFYSYSVLNPPPATWGVFGHFAVNPWTGDVWALLGCHRLSTRSLRRSQALIRRRFTPSEAKRYERLRRVKPDCVYEDTPETAGSPARGLAGIIRDIRAKLDRDRAASASGTPTPLMNR